MDTRKEFITALLRYRSQVFGYIYTVMGDFHVAEDMFQEVSLTAYMKRDTFRSGTNFKAWLLEIARLKILEKKRDFSKHALTMDEQILKNIKIQFEKQKNQWEREKTALQQCMQELSDKSRTIIHLRFNFALAVKKIAERIKTSPSAVHVMLKRIYNKLYECVRIRLSGEEYHNNAR